MYSLYISLTIEQVGSDEQQTGIGILVRAFASQSADVSSVVPSSNIKDI